MPTIQRFAILITEEFKKLRIPQENKHLAIIFAGYRYGVSSSEIGAIFGLVHPHRFAGSATRRAIHSHHTCELFAV